MADSAEAASMDKDAAKHDGRFGERFDDEVSAPAILWITAGLALACALGMLITWGMKGYYSVRAEAEQPSPTAGVEQRLPEGPLLQRDPEGELEAMRHEMSERLSGYGWVNEGAGVVHIPIDEAMDLLVEHGSVAAGGTGAGVAESAEEEPAE